MEARWILSARDFRVFGTAQVSSISAFHGYQMLTGGALACLGVARLATKSARRDMVPASEAITTLARKEPQTLEAGETANSTRTRILRLLRRRHRESGVRRARKEVRNGS